MSDPFAGLHVYLAGPMRGHAEYNFPAFNFAAAQLRAEGFHVFSPAEKGMEIFAKLLGQDQDFDLTFRRIVFALDLGYICDHADIVALLPGWEKSSGAQAERMAALAVGLDIWVLPERFLERPCFLERP